MAKISDSKKAMKYKFRKSIDKKQLLSVLLSFKEEKKNHKDKENKEIQRQRCEEASPNGF